MLKAIAPFFALMFVVSCSPPTQTTVEAPKTTTAAPSTRPAPEGMVDAFAAALRAGDTAAVSRLMASDVIIAESGEVERSYAEYAEHHLPADIAFTAAVTMTPRDRRVIAGSDMATVISRSEVRAVAPFIRIQWRP